MKSYIIFNDYGTYIVAAMESVVVTESRDERVYEAVAECRSLEQARVVMAALERGEEPRPSVRTMLGG